MNFYNLQLLIVMIDTLSFPGISIGSLHSCCNSLNFHFIPLSFMLSDSYYRKTIGFEPSLLLLQQGDRMRVHMALVTRCCGCGECEEREWESGSERWMREKDGERQRG